MEIAALVLTVETLEFVDFITHVVYHANVPNV
jgi:hypothetical protein